MVDPDPNEPASESIWEIRRRAPLHYWAKAENAKFVAYILTHSQGEMVRDLSEKSNYGGTPSVAIREGFLREASIATELMIKAVIAQRIERQVSSLNLREIPANHRLNELWRSAELPLLERNDQYGLTLMKVILYWSGRYAAPIRDRDGYRDREDLDKLIPMKYQSKLGIKIRTMPTFGWDEFENIYRIAAKSFWELRKDGD